ncbi:hypothetical protein GC194_14535 [bacterium]|nr:hypothetical protein [bacterium]
MKNSFKSRLLLLLLSFCALVACRKEVQWQNQKLNVSIPIASTSLSLKNFVAANNYQVDPNGKVNLIYDLAIYNSHPIDYLKIPNREDYHKASLETIRLSNTALSTKVTLADAYPASVLLDGQKINIPALDLDNTTKVDVDANTFFESAQLESGKMYLKVQNGFPVEISYMSFKLTNKSDASLVAEMEFFNIQPGETQIDSADMAGVYAEGLMVGELVKVQTTATTTPVLINPKDAIKFEVSVKNLKAETAKAIFPAQNLIDMDISWNYDFGGPEITDLSIASGTLFMQVESNVDETIYVTFEVPALIDNGDTVVQNFIVPPASNGNPYSASKEISLAGYDVILRGKRGEGWKEVNSFHNRLIARIDSSGVLKEISKSDSITLHIGLIDIVPSYARGYLGQDTFVFGPSKEDISVFRKLNGILNFNNVNMTLDVHNSAGIEAEVVFDNITSKSNSGNKVNLNANLLNNALHVDRAADKSTPYTHSYAFTKDNSNVTAFIENLPVSILYGLQLNINPNGNNSNYNDFIYTESEIDASVVLELPMDVAPKDIVMRDTFTVGFGGLAGQENVSGAHLNFVVYNGYPFAADVDFILLDENNNVFDTLFGDNTIAGPGVVPDFGKKVTEPSKTVFTTYIDKAHLDRVAEIKKAVIITHFTSNVPHTFTIYDSYSIDIKLTADLEYIQNFN